MRETWRLVKTEQDHPITGKTDPGFLMEYQRSVLLELTERGALTELQCRHAVEALRRQRQTQ